MMKFLWVGSQKVRSQNGSLACVALAKALRVGTEEARACLFARTHMGIVLVRVGYGTTGHVQTRGGGMLGGFG